ncbi:hypothetical protein Poli38472_000321 [Pythium oligandrum]|uniref:Uncharacterized protein n=1 Tax=Pythium oligandrum TaxID=41045 RepID=A0A8K1CBF6_PYTOL|nr:hypothetical protein Poli38472_000321 [Pythium oligandrum]|eukprot:TMW60279.1 hypothetical protein Poli38472_000321 [Pythium oligandrum]
MIRDPTLMAYDVKHEQERPFELMDEKILTIDQQARHMHFDENDRVRGSDPNVSPPPGTPSTEDGVLVTKKKRTGYDEKRKSIAYRLIPAFNYEPVLIKFQWSDFVVATPIRNLSSASQLDLLVKTGDAEGAANTADNPAKVTALLTCPVQKMTLLLKKGIRLPCGTYVIVSVFKRPLEDGNENLRVLIYDSERVEEFQYDFHEEHLRDYMEEWHATPDEARAFMTRLEFRREQGMVIIKMPERIRESSVIYIDDRPSSSSSNTTNPLTYFQIHQYPPPLIPKFSLDSLIHATELPPEPQYRISPNAPILPPGTRRTPVDESTSENA